VSGAAREAIRDKAAGWHDQLQRERVSEDTQRAFGRWLAESPEHQAAYEAVERSWRTLRTAPCTPEILALRHETALRLNRATSRSLRPLRWAAAALILVVGGLAALLAARSAQEISGIGGRSVLAWILEPFHGGTNGTYATAVGERLSVTLDDGSQVTLDTQSELQVAFTKGERSVRLAHGQAIFEVAKDSRRPFTVQARDRRFVAVGTAFDVRVDAARVSVTMIEGTVRVERNLARERVAVEADAKGTGSAMPKRTSGGAGGESGVSRYAAPEAAGKPGTAHVSRIEHTRSASDAPGTVAALKVTTLTAGDQLLVDAQNQDYVRTVDPDRVTSWRRGQIIFDATRLADAIAEINRYSQLKIQLADPALADLRLSGAFSTGHPSVFIEAVTTYFPLAVARRDDAAVVLKAR
jgi:transmembrane sensor